MFIVGIFCSNYIELLQHWVDTCLSKIVSDNVIVVVWVDRNNIQYAKDVLKDYSHIVLEGGMSSLVSIKMNTCIYLLRTISILYNKYGAINPNTQLFYIANDIEFNSEYLNIKELDSSKIHLFKNHDIYNKVYGGNISKLYNALNQIKEIIYCTHYTYPRVNGKAPEHFDNDIFKKSVNNFFEINTLDYYQLELDNVLSTNIIDIGDITFNDKANICTCVLTIATDEYISMFDNWINCLYKKVVTQHEKMLIVWTNLENVDRVHNILSYYKDIKYKVYICDLFYGIDAIMNKLLYVYQTIEQLQKLGYNNPKTMLLLFQVSAFYDKDKFELDEKNVEKIYFSRCPTLGVRRIGADFNDYYKIQTKNVKKPICGYCYCLRGGFVFGNIKNMYNMLKKVNAWIQEDMNLHCNYPQYHDELYLTRYFQENPEKCITSFLNVKFLGRRNKKRLFAKKMVQFSFICDKFFRKLW